MSKDLNIDTLTESQMREILRRVTVEQFKVIDAQVTELYSMHVKEGELINKMAKLVMDRRIQIKKFLRLIERYRTIKVDKKENEACTESSPLPEKT